MLALMLAGCAGWPERPPVSAADQAGAVVPGYAGMRRWADAPASEWSDWRARFLADRAAAGTTGPIDTLAISSGSDKGAFSAGYLVGWTASGKRPQFDIVTGVSTGALIAPFAFLGSAYDKDVARLYTGIRPGDIYHQRVLSGLLGGPAFATSKPLEALIAAQVTPAILDTIAAEHGKGRRLLVMTTNLDAGRGMVWDMGAIAASGRPDRIALFRRILLASASIPGVFPPVLIDVDGGGRRFSELHVDGGTTSSLFALPPALLWKNDTPAMPGGGSMTLLYNGRLTPDYKVVKPKALTIMDRALATVIAEADRANIRAYRAFARDHDLRLELVEIDKRFDLENKQRFNPGFMRKLYGFGCKEALDRLGTPERAAACALPASHRGD